MILKFSTRIAMKSLMKFLPRMVSKAQMPNLKDGSIPNYLLKNLSLFLKRLSTLRSISTMKRLAEQVTSVSACHSNI